MAEVGMHPLLLSTSSVAQLLDISRSTLLRMIARGEFPEAQVAIGIGSQRRHPRWRYSDVVALVDEQEALGSVALAKEP